MKDLYIFVAGGRGIIVSNNVELGQKDKYITTPAAKPYPYEYVHDELGYNFPMPNIYAALLLEQLEKLEESRSAKAKIYHQCNDFFTRTDRQIDLIPISKARLSPKELLADVNNIRKL